LLEVVRPAASHLSGEGRLLTPTALAPRPSKADTSEFDSDENLWMLAAIFLNGILHNSLEVFAV